MGAYKTIKQRKEGTTMTLPVRSQGWNPWKELMNLQEEVNRLFSQALGPAATPALFEGDIVPPLDVVREGDRYVVRVDLPGVKKEDIVLSVLNNRLFIRGTKNQETEANEGAYHRRERVFGSFERVVEFPDPIDAEKISAKFTDGVLEVTAPLREEAKPRQIAIEVK
jgi:HSP20 family protein